MTPETLAPYLKAEIENIPINRDYPAIKPRQLRQAIDRAMKRMKNDLR